MPAVKKVRKPEDEGSPTTLWIRKGTRAKAERQAERERMSLSQFTERALVRDLEGRRRGERRTAA